VNPYILVFLVLCLLVGLRSPSKRNTVGITAALAAALVLVLLFTLSSSRL
jgi:hypothetical protein